MAFVCGAKRKSGLSWISRKRGFLGALVLAAATPALPASASTFDVTVPVWGDGTTTHSLAWAIDQANANPGADVIRLYSDVNVDAAVPIPFSGGFLAELTDVAGLRIEGNGFALVGNPEFLSGSGSLVTKHNPQRFSLVNGDKLLMDARSFAKIADNVSGVTVERLNVDGLNGFLDVGRNSVASVVQATARNAVNFGYNGRAVFNAQPDSTLNLRAIVLRDINPFQQLASPYEYVWSGAIVGEDATLNLSRSTLDLFASTAAGAVNWVGGTANVVSSLIVGDGLSIIDHAKQGVLNVVNSLLRPSGQSATARIQAYAGGVANVIASTLQIDSFFAKGVPAPADCPQFYPCNGSPLQAFANGEIHLQSSAVSVLNNNLVGIDYPYADVFTSSTGQPLPGLLTADPYTYVQPVAQQDAAALKVLFHQPNLITAANAYPLDPSGTPPNTFYGLPGGAYPVVSGPLMAVVPDADTINLLINPIDGSVIRTDVFDQPRTQLGYRDSGAVQQRVPVPGPLPLFGLGAALGWSRRLRRL